MDLGAHYGTLIDPILASHRWLICADAAVAARPLLEQLTRLDAPRPLVLAGPMGTGDPLEEGLCELIVLGTRGDTIMSGIRAYQRALRNLTAPTRAAIERWDPKREALVWGFEDDLEIEGRPTYGGRPAAWAELENKTTIDALWDDAGITRSPSMVVPAAADSLLEAHDRLDQGSGTVWAADNREGWHGGAEFVRHVSSRATAIEAATALTPHADSVRVMPFLEGIPCSIHGMVFGDRTIAFRPVEQLIFRIPDTDRLRYSGVATWWDPAPEDREYLRRLAKRVGDHLRDRVDYRAAFTVDGVMTSEGFRPTELNARHAVGLALQARGGPDDEPLPMNGFSRALIAGEDLDFRPGDLEAFVVATADAHRRLRAMLVVAEDTEETDRLPVRIVDGRVVAAHDDPPHGELQYGPSATGGLLVLEVDPTHATTGPSAASVAVSGFRVGARRWGLQVEHLIPADPVR